MIRFVRLCQACSLQSLVVGPAGNTAKLHYHCKIVMLLLAVAHLFCIIGIF